MKRLFVHFIQTLVYSFKNFIKNKNAFIASSLTFYTLMAIIPFLALCFSIAKGLGMQELFEEGLHQGLKEQKAIVQELLPLVDQAIKNTKGGILGALGIIIFLWSSRKVVLYLESSLDQIWKITGKYRLKDKYLKYLFIVIFFPIFLSISAALNIFTSTYLKELFFTEVIDFLLSITPYVIAWIFFFLIYKFFPRTKVHNISAFLGAIFAGSIFQFVESSYLFFQIGLARLGGMYGSFAALPLFFVWIQLSWIILLWGAELSFANQNLAYCKIEKKWENLSHNSQMMIHIWILSVLWKLSKIYKQPVEIKQLAKYAKIPVFPLQKVLNSLIQCGLVKKERKRSFLLVKGVEGKKLYYLIQKMESYGVGYIQIQSKEFKTVLSSLKQMQLSMKTSQANMVLKDVASD